MNTRMFLCVRSNLGRLSLTTAVCLLISCTTVDLQSNSYGPHNRSNGLAAPLINSEHTSTEGYSVALRNLESRLKNVKSADPFILEGDVFEFGWCKSNPDRNRTLKDLSTRLEKDSATSRDMAQLYAATGSVSAYRKAIEFAYSWATKSSLFNAYEQGMNPSEASFPGMERGFCNRSWNMMLDSIWQAYGLINFSEVYSILKGSDLSADYSSELARIEYWLRGRLIPAVNAGCHAWTKYADFNPHSAAYLRYRSDNHLSWCLAGLSTAGLALGDHALLDYVYYGTVYDDGISGPYENPSSLIKLIPYAIHESGNVYDEAERATQHKGFFYGNFSLWALVIAARNTETAGYPSLWEIRITESSGSLASALDRYAPYVANELQITDAKETTKPEFFSFVYRIVSPMEWVQGNRKESYIKAASSSPPQLIRQGLGYIDLISISPENLNKN